MAGEDERVGAPTQLTVLQPAGATLDDAALTELYRYPDGLTHCWVRANMITSADGATTVGGESGALAGRGDRAVFFTLRALADVVLVGAGTVRGEGYSGVTLTDEQRRARRDRGQTDLPPLAIVSRSGALDPDAAAFTATQVRPLIVTTRRAVPAARDRLGALAEVIDGSATDPDVVDEAAVLAALGRRRLLRVLTEGGPRLLGGVVARDLLDELCLTLSPLLVGGSSTRVSAGAAAVRSPLRLAHQLTDPDGYLYLRYLRATGTG
ncbi:pyrimidine reductase family protein [Mycobacterium sp. MYCO198283]|nr:pyrimidine reductase family protein [Mycobacterium sp. MYCO198283]MCG5433921.1 pyrimidine reductase family protein [Mycobacterium sp. MYCO198283]